MSQISRAHLSEIERGHVENPSAVVLQRLGDALGVTTADLLGSSNLTDMETLSPSLREYAQLVQLSSDDLTMLAAIRYRGTQPTNIKDWQYLHESIKRSMSHLGANKGE